MKRAIFTNARHHLTPVYLVAGLWSATLGISSRVGS